MAGLDWLGDRPFFGPVRLKQSSDMVPKIESSGTSCSVTERYKKLLGLFPLPRVSFHIDYIDFILFLFKLSGDG